jgi:hypothetical protein
MSPYNDLLSSSNAHTIKTRKREGRNCHYLPKIKDFLENSSSWKILQKKEEYEFPGYGSSEGLYFCKNHAKTPFAAKSRVHLINDDNQLSNESPSQTQIHDINIDDFNIDGIKTKVHVKHSACEGVKVCS